MRKIKVKVLYSRHDDTVLVSFDDEASVYSVFISPENAEAIGAVGAMARATREQKDASKKG